LNVSFEITVYGGLTDIPYVSQCLRKRDVRFFEKLLDLGHADATVHNRIAVWTYSPNVYDPSVERATFHHPSRGEFRDATFEAVHLSRPARPLPSCAPDLKERNKFATPDQNRALFVDCWKPSLNPLTHGIFVNAEQPGDFIYRIAAVALNPAVVRVTFSPAQLVFMVAAHHRGFGRS
jgi:hypothetical protein